MHPKVATHCGNHSTCICQQLQLNYHLMFFACRHLSHYTPIPLNHSDFQCSISLYQTPLCFPQIPLSVATTSSGCRSTAATTRPEDQRNPSHRFVSGRGYSQITARRGSDRGVHCTEPAPSAALCNAKHAPNLLSDAERGQLRLRKQLRSRAAPN